MPVQAIYREHNPTKLAEVAPRSGMERIRRPAGRPTEYTLESTTGCFLPTGFVEEKGSSCLGAMPSTFLRVQEVEFILIWDVQQSFSTEPLRHGTRLCTRKSPRASAHARWKTEKPSR